MSVQTIDTDRYAELLGRALPAVIRTEEQNDHYLAVLDQLTRSDDASPAERQLADLLTVLIEDFEENHYALKASSPVRCSDCSFHFMEQHGLKQKDLVDVFGTEGIVSEVLRAKRDFSKEHIRRLAKRFGVSLELFFA